MTTGEIKKSLLERAAGVGVQIPPERLDLLVSTEREILDASGEADDGGEVRDFWLGDPQAAPGQPFPDDDDPEKPPPAQR